MCFFSAAGLQIVSFLRWSRRISFLAKSSLAVMAVLLPCVPQGRAQLTSSSILGYVYDPSGAGISNAEVSLYDARHSVDRTTRTDSSGAYTFVGLPPATYNMSVSAPNFVKIAQPNVTLEINTQLRTDFHLPLAGVGNTIEVQAFVNPLQTESAELGAVITQQQIETLPLNRRDFLTLALLSPGVLPPVQNSELSTRGAFSMHAGGGREEFNNFLLDGVDNNDPYVNRYGVEPPVDSIQEFKIVTSSYSAEYGRSAAGQVNVITRQGANEFHGALYEYWRSQALDARNFFDGPDKPSLSRNQFGFSAGGPIIRGRTFFFADTDFLRDRESVTQLASVPTMAERSGDLSALPVTVVDPYTGQPFPGNVIPSDRISPVALSILKLFPTPNLSGSASNFRGKPALTENDTQGSYRVDHHLSQFGVLTFRYSFGAIDLFEPYTGTTTLVPGFGDYVRDHIQNATAQYQQAVGSRASNSLRLSFNRFSRDLLPENYLVDAAKQWGVSWINVPPVAFGYPGVNVGGFSSVGDNASTPLLRHTNTYQIGDSVTLDRGPHLLKFGGEVRKLQLNSIVDLFKRGSLSFSGGISGSGISDLLLGFPSFGIQVQSNNPIALRTQAYAGYFEDDWRISRNVTLNLGLRYEYNTPVVDPRNGMTVLDFQTGQVVPVGSNGISRSGIQPDRNNFAPRIGIAWSPAQNWVIRSGYGVYYDSGMFVVPSALYFNPPQFNLQVFFPSPAGLLTLDNPFPSDTGFTPPPALSILNPNIRTSYLQQWNLTVERSFASWGTLTVGYAGSKGTKLIRGFDLNQPVPGPGFLQARRPYPQYGNIFDIESGGNSSFNSLQAIYNKRMWSRFSLWIAYTYSKSIDTASAFLGLPEDPNFPQNSHDLNAERGNSSFDMPHRFVAAYVVKLPQSNVWTRDTEIRGITTIESGQSFTPLLQFDNSNTGNTGSSAGSDRPNVVGNPNIGYCPDPSGGAPIPVGTANCWFNTGAFAIPLPNTFGNAGRNILRGPGYASFDLSLFRNFNIRENFKLSFEAEAFNLFNRANFDLPQNFADNPNSFGRINSAKPARQIQLAVRFRF
jgi:hypothetical protein